MTQTVGRGGSIGVKAYEWEIWAPLPSAGSQVALGQGLAPAKAPLLWVTS